MAKNFPKLGRDLDTQVHEAHRLPNKFSLKVSSPRHIVKNMSKIKENLNSRKIKEACNLQGNPHKFISGFTGSQQNHRGQERVE